MSFLYPSLLLGLVAVGLPVAIHLLDRMRVRHTRWAANRFLREIVKRRQSYSRLKDLLLLLLRCLVVALLVLAFAHPFIDDGRQSNLTGASIVYLLVDASASMQQSDGAKTRFELAKEKGAQIIDQLPSGSAAALILFTDEPQPVIGAPTLDLALVKRSLQQASPTDRASDAASSLQLALDRLAQIQGTHRSIEILTDGQADVWKDDQTIRAAAEAHSDIAVNAVILGDGNIPNRGITDVELNEGSAMAGGAVDVKVEVSNPSDEDATNEQVSIALDGAPPADQQVIDRIPAGGAKTVHLSAALPKAGPHVIEAAINSDALVVDNHRALAFNASSRQKALLYAGPDKSAQVAAFFLGHALVPVPPDKVKAFPIKVETIGVPPPAYSADLDCVFVIGPESLSADAVAQLRKYVMQGGSVVVIPDAGTQPAIAGDPAWKDMLPDMDAKIVTTQGGTNWQQSGFTHPITSIWDLPESGNLGSVAAFRFLPFKIGSGEQAGEWRSVVRYSTRVPAIVERSLGSGHVIVFSAALDPDAQNLVLHPAFVPLVQRLVHFAAGSANQELNIKPGELFRGEVDPAFVAQDFYVQRMGSHQPPRLAGRVEQADGKTRVEVQDTATVGAYLVTVKGHDDPIAAFAVQLAPEETDLRRVPADKLPLKSAKAQPVAAAAQATGHFAWPSWMPSDFWTPLVVLAFVASVAEMVLAHLSSYRRDQA